MKDIEVWILSAAAWNHDPRCPFVPELRESPHTLSPQTKRPTTSPLGNASNPLRLLGLLFTATRHSLGMATQETSGLLPQGTPADTGGVGTLEEPGALPATPPEKASGPRGLFCILLFLTTSAFLFRPNLTY